LFTSSNEETRNDSPEPFTHDETFEAADSVPPENHEQSKFALNIHFREKRLPIFVFFCVIFVLGPFGKHPSAK